MEKFFSNKKILFIAPAFFGYEKEIKCRLKNLGASVDYFDDRPSTRAWSKIAIRVMPRLQRREVRTYFHDLLRRSRSDYDFVFIIKLECMPLDILLELKERNSDAKFIYYSWDSIKNNQNIKKAFHIFDSAFTFDEHDASAFDSFKFRPLFFLNEYRDLPTAGGRYDLSFIGSAHSDRYLLTQKIKSAFPSENFRTFFFLYMSSRWVCALRRLFMPAFWGAKTSEFSFKPLAKSDILEIVSASKVILDFQHPNQTGLTMRTIEMLGARRKLITTNTNVRKYDFYNPDNITIIDRAAPVIQADFFDKPYVPLTESLYEKYSIDGWIAEVFAIPRAAIKA